MEQTRKTSRNWLVIAGIAFVITVVLLLLLGIAFGASYRKTLSEFVGEPKINELTTTEVKKIKKVTFQKRSSAGCIEVTPDGIVRVYSVCGDELDSADRLTDTKNINKLFQLLREKEYKSQKFSDSDEVYQVIVETETGTEIFYVVVGSDDPAAEELLETLEDVQEDIPETTPTPTPLNPSPSIGSSVTPQASASLPPGTSPEPSPTPIVDNPFICDFSEGKKPTSISNILCTSDPSPPP